MLRVPGWPGPLTAAVPVRPAGAGPVCSCRPTRELRGRLASRSARRALPCSIAGRPARAASPSLPTAIVPPPGALGAMAVLVVSGPCGARRRIDGRFLVGLPAPAASADAARSPGILRAGGWPGSGRIGSPPVSPDTPGRPGVARAVRWTGTSPAGAAGVAPGPRPCHVGPLARCISGRTLGPTHPPIASASLVQTGRPLRVPSAIVAGISGSAPGGTRSGPTVRLAVAVPGFVRGCRPRHLGRTLGLRLAPRLILRTAVAAAAGSFCVRRGTRYMLWHGRALNRVSP